MQREVTSREVTPQPVGERESAQSAPGARCAQAWNYVLRHATRPLEALSLVRSWPVAVGRALPESHTDSRRYDAEDRAGARVAIGCS